MQTLPVSFWSLGWRSLWRDWRAGELRLLLLAVTLAVAALTAVAFFADRLQGGLQRDARALIGGDAVIQSDQPAPPAFAEKAKTLGLQSVQTLSFPTMGRARDEDGGAARLVALKVVAPGYPLRGGLRVADGPDAAEAATRDIPAPGTVWVDAALLSALDLKIGQPLLLGDASLTLAKVIVVESDRGAGFMSFAPRVMINAADLPATALVQPASRIGYRLALAGPEPAVKQYVAWAEVEIKKPGVRGLRLESLEGGRPEMQQTLARAEKFLNLVALLAALLSAVAVAIAARGFAQRHLDDCAMLRVLGLSQGAMARAYAFEFIAVGLAASALGVLAGFALHYVFVLLLAGLVESALPAASVWPVLLGLGMGLTLMVAFGLPPVLQLAQVPPLRVVRRDVGQLKPATLVVLGLGVAGFAVLLLAASRDLKLGGIAVGGFAAAVAVFQGWDSGLAAGLWPLRQALQARGLQWDARSLPEGLQDMLALVEARAAKPPLAHDGPTPVAVPLRRGSEAARTVAFFGDVLLAIARSAQGRGSARAADVWRQIDETGPQSVPIVLMTCALIGLMLAYMGGAQLGRIGAQYFVADVVTVGMVRELAGLMTGVILAGRLGAAFAAHIGTMQANEEIDALRALGVDPISYLVLPRLLAMVVVAPALIVLGAAVGVLAAWPVATQTYGVASAEYWHQCWRAITVTHVLIGLFKGVLYVALIALAGCREGLHAGRNAQAVGQATTAAVVKALVWIVIAACGTTVVFSSLGY